MRKTASLNFRTPDVIEGDFSRQPPLQKSKGGEEADLEKKGKTQRYLRISVFSVPPLRPLWLKNALFYDTCRDLQGMDGFFQINDTIIIDIPF